MARDMSTRSTTVALICSAAVHIAVVVAAGVVSKSAAAWDGVPASDQWAGDTFDIEALLPRGGGQSAEALPAPPSKEPATSLPEPVPPPKAEKPSVPLPTPEPAAPDEPAVSPPKVERPPAKAPHPPAGAATRDRNVDSSPVSSVPTVASGAAPAGSGGEVGTGSAGSSGAVGVGGVRNLAVAVTRAIPIAVSGDPVWGTLALGNAGSLDLRIEVDEAGKIVSAAPATTPVAPHLQRLVERTLPFLRAGRFALSNMTVTAGVETLRISVSVSEVAGGVADEDRSAGPYALGFEPPRDGQPGRGYFTLRSGRHVEVLVKVIGAR